MTAIRHQYEADFCYLSRPFSKDWCRVLLTGDVLLRLWVVRSLPSLLAGHVLREVAGVLLVVKVEASSTLILHGNTITVTWKGG